MERFDLAIFNQKRAVFGLVLFGISLPLSLFAGLEFETLLNNVLISLSIFSFICILLYNFVIGYLTVTVNNEAVDFNWSKKLLFNYKQIETIRLSDIRILVIDNVQGRGKVLRKIISHGRSIPIHNGLGSFKKNSQEFISYISMNSRAEIIDSWGVWKRRGWLKIAYIINNTLIIAGLGIVIMYILKKGFSSHLLLYMILPISQLFLYKFQMKDKIN